LTKPYFSWMSSAAGVTHLRRHWRILIAAAILVLAGLSVTTGRLFVWPQQGMPGRVDAIIVLDGPGDRLDTGFKLARAHRAPVLVISRGSPYSDPNRNCAPPRSSLTLRMIFWSPVLPGKVQQRTGIPSR
jgi:hypothetical protein